MAISKEQLTVKVELDSDGAVKSFKVINDQLSELDKKTQQSSSAFSNMEQALQDTALAIGTVSVALSTLNTNSIPKLISGFSQTGKATAQTISNLALMSRELGVFAKLSSELAADASSSGLVVLKNTSEQAVPAIINLSNTVKKSFAQIQTSYQMTQAAQLSFMDSFMRMIPALKSGASEIGTAVKVFSGIFVSAFSERGLIGLLKEFGVNIATAFSITNFQSAASALSKSFIMLKDGFANTGLAIFNVAKDIPNSIGKIQQGFAAIPNITKDFFAFGKTIINSHVGPTIIGLAESSMLLRGGLISLGSALLTSDSAFVKIAGSAAVVAGILLGGFAFAVKTALAFVGDLISAIGDKLISTMTNFEAKFRKAEVAVANFNFTIAGMSREFGESAGTLQSWTAIVDELAEKTLITATDARKMAAEIMSVGKGLGLTKIQMEDLIRLIPNYIKAGDDAFDVTVSFLQALGGAPQGLLKYAVHLSDAGVEHSKFAKQSHLTMQALTEEQKVQARFNALMEQSAPIMGRANLQLQTVAGSQQYLANTILSVQEKLGRQSTLITALNMAFAKLATQALKLPDSLYATVGILQDVGGVALKVIGTFISFAFPIAALASLFAVLNAAVASNATVQLVLTKALTVTNVALGGQAIAVTSASALWSGLATILKGVVVTSFSALMSSLAGAATAVWGFTTAMLANPLFWKAAAVVAGIIAVVAAIKRIEEETKIFSQLLAEIIYPFEQLIAAFSSAEGTGRSFSEVIGVVLRKAVSVAVIAIGGFINGIFTLTFAMAKLLDVVTFGQFEIFSQAAEYALDKMNRLSNSLEMAATDLSDFSAKAYAAVPATDALGKGAEEARNKLSGLNKELMTSNEKALIDAQTQGRQLEALLLSKVVAQDKMKLAKELSEKQNLTREIYQIDAQIAQFPVEAFKEASQSYNQLKIQNLEQLNTIASIRQAGALKAREALKPLTDKIKEIKLLPSTASTKAALDQLKALYSATQQAINDDVISKVEDLKAARENAELSALMTYAQLMGDSALIAEAQYQKDLKEYQKLLSDKLISEQAYEDAKKKLGQKKEEAQKAPEAKTTQDNIKMAGDMISAAASGADALVSKAIPEMGKVLATAMGLPPEMGAMVGQLINFLRQGGEALKTFGTELIKIVVELPLMIAEGIVGLIEGLLQGIMDMLGDPARLAKVMTALTNLVPKIITTLAKAIPSLLKMLLDPGFWIEFASQIVRSLWDAFVEMFYALGDMFASIFSGDIFEGPDKAVKQMGETVDAGIRYATNAITGVSEQMFGVMEDTGQAQSKRADGGGVSGDAAARKKEASWFQKWILDPIKRYTNFLWEGIKGVGEYVWGIFEPLIEVVMKTLVGGIQVGMEIVSKTFEIVGIGLSTVWKASVEYFKGAWNVTMSVFKSVWNVGVELFKGVINYFKAIWDGAVGILKAVWDYVKALFNAVVDSFKAVFDFVVTLFDDPIKAFENLWEDLKNIFSDLWESIEGIGTALWDAISGIGKAVLDMFKGVGGAIWEGLKSFGSAIWDMFSNVGGAIWDGVKKGWNAIVDLFKNIGNILWDSLKGVFDSTGNFFRNLFKFDGGGTGAVEDFLGFDFPWFSFAEGGKVPGTPNVIGDSAKNDTVAALLSPGEFVIPRSKMQDPNNLLLIDAIMSGGKASDWINKALFGGIEKKASGGEIANSSYGKWLSKAQSGGLEFHFSMSDLDPTNKNGALRKGIAELDPTNPNSAVGGLVEQVWNGVKEAGGFIGDLFVPDWIKKMWDSITKFLSEVDIKDLVTNPFGAIKDAIRAVLDGANFLTEPFKKMMSFSNKGTGGGKANNEFESKQKEHLETFKITSELQDIIKNLFPNGIEIGDIFPNGINMGAIGRNLGGFVPGSGNTDSVPAMLTPGEFVINKNAAQSLGGGLLNQLNAGMMPSMGGMGQTANFNITLNIETTQAIDETFIRQKLLPTIKQEIKSSSLRGEFLLSDKGVRR